MARMRSAAGGALAVVGVGAAVLLLFWHADLLRLRPSGVNLVWPAMVAFGIALATSKGAGPARAAAGMLIGSLVGVAAVGLSLRELPVVPIGVGIGAGLAAMVCALVVLISRGWIPAAAVAASFGTGIGAAELFRLEVTSTVSDALAAWTATAFAMLLGVAATQAAEAWRSMRAGEEVPEPPALPEPARRAPARLPARTPRRPAAARPRGRS